MLKHELFSKEVRLKKKIPNGKLFTIFTQITLCIVHYQTLVFK